MKGYYLVGYNLVTKVDCVITEDDIINGYSIQPCHECSGTGKWDFHIEDIIEDCVVCKGAGKIYISC